MPENKKQNPNPKMRVRFITLGCKVNQYETQALTEQFQSQGVSITSDKADIYIINTCTVTVSADSKSRAAIRKAKKENPAAKIAVLGCLAQLNKNAIEKLGVDWIIPQDKKAAAASIILGQQNEARGIWELSVNNFYNYRVFVKIQDGCDNCCTFCKIPYVRGQSISRGKKAIIDEIERLSSRHQEIVLCGINVGLYGRDLIPKCNLAGLIQDILKIKQLGRLRLSSLEPYLCDDELLLLLKNNKFCPHLYLPFQSGDDSILRAMNKKETVALYERVVAKARAINPLVAISCDILVGFPDETEESFQNTLMFLKRIQPMRMHIFTFSPREKTKFYGMKIKNQKVVRERRAILQKLALEFSLAYHEKFLGKILHMTLEEEKNGFIYGYTENYIRIMIKDKLNLGQIVPVVIEKADKNKVFGSLVKV